MMKQSDIEYNEKERGFSLIELIGVLAIIAVLGSIAAPRIFKTIEDSKASTVVENIHNLKTTVAQFYKDTGRQPYQYSDLTSGGYVKYHQLTNNKAKIKGWNGPYLESELDNPFKGVARIYGYNGNAFDMDGDGTDDVKGVTLYYINNVPYRQAKAISDAIDHDGDKTGAAAWYTGGTVRTYNRKEPAETGTTTLYILLASF